MNSRIPGHQIVNSPSCPYTTRPQTFRGQYGQCRVEILIGTSTTNIIDNVSAASTPHHGGSLFSRPWSPWVIEAVFRISMHETVISPSFQLFWIHHKLVLLMLSNVDIIDTVQRYPQLLQGNGRSQEASSATSPCGSFGSCLAMA